MATRPYKPSIMQMLENGGTHIAEKLGRKGEAAVLFSLDHGKLARNDVRNVIKEDGIRRNLHWGIELEDISGVWGNSLTDRDEELFDHMLGEGATEREVANTKQRIRAPSRHVLSFRHRNEARRFVREWHRRPLPGKGELGLDELPRLVNAEIIW
jgi:hypothetical protein